MVLGSIIAYNCPTSRYSFPEEQTIKLFNTSSIFERRLRGIFDRPFSLSKKPIVISIFLSSPTKCARSSLFIFFCVNNCSKSTLNDGFPETS